MSPFVSPRVGFGPRPRRPGQLIGGVVTVGDGPFGVVLAGDSIGVVVAVNISRQGRDDVRGGHAPSERYLGVKDGRHPVGVIVGEHRADLRPRPADRPRQGGQPVARIVREDGLRAADSAV